jgi:hypothetical protein
MTDLNFQNLSTVQNQNQPQPNTIASTTTIAPVTFLTFVSGTEAVATITPPVTGQHMLALIFTNGSPGTMVTTGNILTAVVPTQNIPCLMFYDPAQAKYYGCANNLT